MLREKMELRIKLLTMPLTEFDFYQKKNCKTENGNNFFDILEYFIFDNRKKAPSSPYVQDKLIRIFAKNLNLSSTINNLDEIKLLIQKYYGYDYLISNSNKGKNISSFYLYHLQKISSFFLTHRNGKIAIKYWESENEESFLGPYKGLKKIAMWNSLERMFTTEILTMIYLINNNMEENFYLKGYQGTVKLADTQLEEILNKGVAENHLHLNLGGNFYYIWQKFMSEYNIFNKETVFKDTILGKEYANLIPYIQAISSVRILLAKYLSEPEEQKDFIVYYSKYHTNCMGLEVDIPKFLKSIYDGNILEYNKKNLEELKTYFNLTVSFPTQNKDWQKELAEKDLIFNFIENAGEFNTVENIFLFNCLKYITHHENDLNFSQIFWQYVRIKNETFQLFVKTNQIRGLDYFTDFVNRKPGAARKDWNFILYNQLKNQQISKLEVRIFPFIDKNNPNKKLANDLVEILSSYKDILCNPINNLDDTLNFPKIGIVYHFQKREDNIEKCWLGYKPDNSNSSNTFFKDERTLPTKLYFKELQEETLLQLNAINDLRESIPNLSNYIVGIDAAGRETNTEPWVFSDIFRRARDSKSHKLIYTNSQEKTIRNLGFTYHVGEEFRHIISGIRHIQEVLEHFQFHAGDRIGHGIALGTNIKKWLQKNSVVILPRIEYLENLLWIWGVHKKGLLLGLDNSFLEQKIMSIAEQIYIKIDGLNVFVLWKAYQNKFRPFEIDKQFEFSENANENQNKLFCPYIKTDNIWTLESLTHAQHCKCYLARMIEPIQISTEFEDLDLITQLQLNVRKQVSVEGIVIETNPTSNTSIGEINDLFEHYISTLNTRTLNNSNSSSNGLMVTINSDDPLIFNTNISNEYAYIFYSLIEKNYARSDVLNWIDQIREVGLRSSFIQTRNCTKKTILIELDAIIKDLKELL